MDLLIGYKTSSIVYKCNFRKVALHEPGHITLTLLIEYPGILTEVRCKYKFYTFKVSSYQSKEQEKKYEHGTSSQ